MILYVHKANLILEIAKETGMVKKNVLALLDSLQSNITKTLKKGVKVNIIGFGSFTAVKTPARKGRNPQTGKEMQIKAGKRVKFRAGQALKDAVK